MNTDTKSMQAIDETVSTVEAVVPVVEEGLNTVEEVVFGAGTALGGVPTDELRKELAEVRALFETLANEFKTIKVVVEEVKSAVKTVEELKNKVPTLESIETLVPEVAKGYCGCFSRKK
jgi:archaellum component FlaC